jgi:hypothetical protein
MVVIANKAAAAKQRLRIVESPVSEACWLLELNENSVARPGLRRGSRKAPCKQR